ncbi:hypothetical protein CC78DRAFT_575000 [Lojkania enalia]|uniref:Uncharacterized protein n=1 Tax=Lojkania enalia TaxID=147567 RepID=A0A9P4TQ37_9PLEO|nr:hypothetical protein CC78DRAFT_575000 [Didymosphaeria enalia]
MAPTSASYTSKPVSSNPRNDSDSQNPSTKSRTSHAHGSRRLTSLLLRNLQPTTRLPRLPSAKPRSANSEFDYLANEITSLTTHITRTVIIRTGIHNPKRRRTANKELSPAPPSSSVAVVVEDDMESEFENVSSRMEWKTEPSRGARDTTLATSGTYMDISISQSTSRDSETPSTTSSHLSYPSTHCTISHADDTNEASTTIPPAYSPQLSSSQPRNTTTLTFTPACSPTALDNWPYLPLSLQVLLFICLALGFIWVVFVILISFPPSFLPHIPPKYFSSEGEQTSKPRFTLAWPRVLDWMFGGRGRNKPLDKPSKYVFPSANGNEHASTTATPAWMNARRRTNRSPPSQTPNRNQNQNLNPDIHIHSTVSPPPNLSGYTANLSRHKTLESPQNPYIPAPQHIQHRRTSAEWLAEREIFLSGSTSPHSSYPPSDTAVQVQMQVAAPGIEALAGATTTSSLAVPPDSNRQDIHFLGTAAKDPESEQRKGKKKKKKKRRSLLGSIDGAVTGFAARVARWTDDTADADGGLLLPLAKGKAD